MRLDGLALLIVLNGRSYCRHQEKAGSIPATPIMKVDLSKASTCAKCGSPQGLQRHHKGCEKMFTRHFASRKGTKTYDAFVERYWGFKECDVVRLCGSCHKKIHRIYFRIIGRWATKHGKISHWSWALAYELMQALRNRCDLWLKNKTVTRRSKLHRVITSAKPRS